MMVENSAGKIYYGMHFVPGVAQYASSEKDPQRIFINETTLRKLDPTFQGKPIFVDHVDEVSQDVDKLKKEADGWVIESFFNSADGKHWVKFIVTSKRAEQAIANGFRLSNAYLPELNNKSGEWNAVPYQNEVIGGEYEHLAIVKNPRYEESVILTPEQFKKYNEKLQDELKRISNSKKETPGMLKFWNRKPVENAADFSSTFVTLARSQKSYSIEHIVNAMDDVEELKNTVTLKDGTVCNVKDLIEKYETLKLENAKMKKNKEEEEKDVEMKKEKVEVEGDLKNEDKEEKMVRKEDMEDEEEEKEEEKEEMKNKGKKKNSAQNSEHFNSLKNAPNVQNKMPETYDSATNKLSRGKSRYGSQ